MIHIRPSYTLLLLLCAGANAASINTTLTIDTTGALSGTTFTYSGTASLTDIGNGTFAGSLSVTTITNPTITAPFTITLSEGGGTIIGTISVPASVFAGGGASASGTATITGGTGPYAGAQGSFSLTGTATGNLASGLTFHFSGPGTIVTGEGGPAPTITAVWDAASNTPGLAPGSIFIVKGDNLCPSGVNFYSVPRPIVSSDGVSITFTPSIGAPTNALIWYTYNPSRRCQLAAILPSSVTPGIYSVTVTNGSPSEPFPTIVVPAKPALFTQDSTGTGRASVQNVISNSVVDLNSFTSGIANATTISPAKPGQFLQAYGTGLGAAVGVDNVIAPLYDFTLTGATVQAIIGGATVPVTFAGRAGYAGQDQINFQLPADVPTGCTVPLQISVNGVRSNTTFIAIAPDVGSAACVQPGFTTEDLQRFDQGATYAVGSFGLTQISQTVPEIANAKFNTAAGTFFRFGGTQLAAASSQIGGFAAPGSCQVTQTRSGLGFSPTPDYTTLDAGTVTLNGPEASGISNRQFQQNLFYDPLKDKNLMAYSLTLASEGLPTVPQVPAETGTIVGGTYTLSGTGGADVGAFAASVSVGPPLTISGQLPSTINRGEGLTLNWTGGNATDIVQIRGNSSTTTGTGAAAVTDTTSFACYTTAGPGTFTVPASILNQLPPIAASPTGSGGTLQVVSTPNPSSGNGVFRAPLTGGGSINYGLFTALMGVSGVVSYQ